MRIIAELKLFGISVLWGIGFDAAYNFLRILRQYVKHGTIWTGIEDFIFCIGVGIVLFKDIFDSNDGVIRWYILFGTALGMWIHFKTMGMLVMFLSQKTSGAVKHVSGLVLMKLKNIFRFISSGILKKRKE